jgi:DNA-binding PadR family transcriptional regulator
MDEEPKLTPLRLAILGLVDMYPQSGYDLKKVFETTPMGNFSSSPGAIYPALKSLERQRWVRGTAENTESLRPRLVYSITAEGERVLIAELERPVTHEDMIWHFDLVMLRFAFIEKLGHAEALRFLGEFGSEAAAYVSYLEGLRETMGPQLSPCGRLALEHGIASSAANARWAERAIGELETPDIERWERT